jgi:potassium channel
MKESIRRRKSKSFAINEPFHVHAILMARENYKRNNMPLWNRYLIHPNSRFKIIWDLIIIVMSVYNSIIIPYEFAYSIDPHIALIIFDYMIDALFLVDIFINFRTIYKDKTDTEVKDGRKIAIRYVIYGRFPIDILASMPLDVITFFFKTSSSNLKFLGMMKMMRLLRLGRMISFLK